MVIKSEYNCFLQVLTNVKSIGKAAFYCDFFLEEVELNEGLSAILDSAFGHCVRLSSLSIPESVPAIGKDAFASCDLLVLKVSRDSFAYQYAQKNRILYQEKE